MKIYKTEDGPAAELEAGEIPGSIDRDGDIFLPVGGKYYRISAIQLCGYGAIPILDMDMTDMPTGGHPVKEGGQEDEQKSFDEY